MLQVVQCSVQQSGNSKVLRDVVAKMPRADKYCTRQPHLEGEEVFGPQNCKEDMSLGSEFEWIE